ncbi:neuropeptide-like 1 isoform X1 [Periplaneta americana]|uniref:neuropeptide-like 1 isoform X1 n=1 Tax=Periplaneta americana TaxID=6978 RepID=UPI0037E80E73
MWLYRVPLLVLAVLYIVALPQVQPEETPESQHEVDKRHVGVLARTGQLPFQGKRSYSSLVRNGDLPFFIRKEWNKKTHPMMSGRNFAEILQPGKRYVGSLAKTGGLPGKRSDDSEVNNLLQSVLATEDLWRLQLKALKQELMREEEEELEETLPEEVTDEEKRNLASLARGGNLPFKEGKRSVEALARAGYLPVPKPPQESEEYPHDSSETSEELIGKRSIASLAKTGQLKNFFQDEEGKRGGIGSLARNGYLPQKREDDDLDSLIQELYQEEDKRNIASMMRNKISPFQEGKRNLGSIARGGGYRLVKKDEDEDVLEEDKRNIASMMRNKISPFQEGKRNLGSLARGGGFRLSKKDDEDDTLDEDKRNVASMMRNKISPFQQEGKRYLGSIMRGQGSSFGISKKDDGDQEEDKRNIGAMARNWHLPEHLKYGKRFDDEEEDVEDIAKRYVATLLRHGRLPVGASNDNSDDMSDDKRHIGSLAAKGSFQVHKKSSRSTGSDDASYNTTDAAGKTKRSVAAPENQIQASTTSSDGAKRTKRQAYLVPATSSDEFPMPVMQNSDLFDYEDLTELLSGGAAPEKRFLGSVARSGWFRDGNRNRSPLTKRHIGSLARLGWLPAFRSSRYSRSGRASPAPLAPAEDEDDKAAAPRSALADARHTFASGDRILYH